ncbi:uncharacterized protein LOC114910200 isoform X2 [Scleropages formosus]|uniref:uncharacterized protein LOC114910200 isoform X2 n=1 Tax=Scleropages formosus TaxID=113540 RepID=UPI0010FA96DA|nr:uncharacterized protein LOC114910200 isoform X2 [Scleropages formosus]
MEREEELEKEAGGCRGAESLPQPPPAGSTSCSTSTSDSSAVQVSSWLAEDPGQSCSLSTQQGLVTMAKDSGLSKQGGSSCSLHLELQDSRLSPALPLLPAHFNKTHSLFEDSTFHHTNLDFIPLRGSPDVSVVSEQFPMQFHFREAATLENSELSWSNQAKDQVSLSQHPLTLKAAFPEDAGSCCSLSEHTLSPASADKDEDSDEDPFHTGLDDVGGLEDQKALNADRKEQSSLNENAQEKPQKATPEDDALNVSVSIQLSRVLEKDAGDLSSSSTTVSSASKLSLSKTTSRESKTAKESDPEEAFPGRQQEITVKDCEQNMFRSTDDKSIVNSQCLPGENSFSIPKQMEKSKEVLAGAELSNITDRSPCAPQESRSNELHQQMSCDIENIQQTKPGTKAEKDDIPIPKGSQSVTPNMESEGTHSERESTIIEVPVGTSKAQLSAGCSFEQGHADKEVLSSGNRAAVDGSFLGLLSQPVFQSTPGVFSGSCQANVPLASGKLSPVTTRIEVSSTSVSKDQGGSSKIKPAADFSGLIKGCSSESLKPISASLQSSGKIQSLPSMSYIEKVGAWNTNQSSSETYFDKLTLERFTVMSSKSKAFDTVSDSSDCMMSHQGSSTLLPPKASRSSISNRSPRWNLAPSFSGQVTSVSGDLGGGNSSSLILSDRSQSICTPNKEVQLSGGLQVNLKFTSGSSDVCQSTEISGGRPNRDQAPSPTGASRSGMNQRLTYQTGHPQNKPEGGHVQCGTDRAGWQEFRAGSIDGDAGRDFLGSAAGMQLPAQLLSRVAALGRFSDVSSCRDLNSTLASSQDGYHCDQKGAVSTGAVSSVVSLEVDNYDPNWMTNPSTPAAEEFNIEERIPMYLHNLGINQSPSTVLTPFVPSGPIRETEFSPTATDLCTIKGSTCTPPKSIQPSEENTPQKEFSTSSLMSLGSNACIPLSVDYIPPTKFLSLPTTSNSSIDRLLSQSSLQTAFRPLKDALDNASSDTLPQQPPEGETPLLETTQPQGGESLPTSSVEEPTEKFCTSKLLNTQDRVSPTAQLSKTPSVSITRPSEVVLTGSLDEDWNSLVGTKTLQEIRKLLGKTEDTVSVKTSFPSSLASAQGSDNSVLCEERKVVHFQVSGTSSAANPEANSSLLWEGSISESVLTSGELRNGSSRELLQSDRPLVCGPAAFKSVRSFVEKEPHSVALGGLLGQTAEPFAPRSVRREPEGCSAGVPDKVAPIASSVAEVNTSEASSDTQSEDAMALNNFVDGPPAASSCESSAQRGLKLRPGEAEQATESDSSSATDSLAARVASLLRNESPATVTSSQASAVDKEDHRTRESSKVLGPNGGLLDLNAQDRQRIEEIKRELVLSARHHVKRQLSSETDSGSQSSSGAYWRQLPDQALRTTDHHRLLDSTMQQNLEARVREIARREGLLLPGISMKPITAITVSSCHQRPSSSTHSTSPSSSPLRFAHHPADVVPKCTARESPSESQEPAVTQREGTNVPRNALTAIVLKSGLSDYITAPEQHEADSVSEPEVQSGALTLGSSLSPEKKTLNEKDAGLGKDSVGSFDPLAGTTHLFSSTGYRQISRSFPDVGNTSTALEHRDSPLHVTSSVSSSSITSPTKKVLLHMPCSQSPRQLGGHAEEGAISRSRQISGITFNKQQAHLSPDSSARRTSQYPFAEAAHRLPSSDDWPRKVPSSHFPVSVETSEQPGVALKPLLFEDVGLKREQDPVRNPYCETAGTSVQITTGDELQIAQPTGLSNTFPSQKLTSQSQPLSCETPAMPVLLPYKPHGSPEVFYVPQTEALLSPVSTMESSHPGSDDAVPPKFSPEVLGSRDQEEDCGVTIKHAEGVYSKRQAESRGFLGSNIKEGTTFATENSQNSSRYPLSLETTMQSSLQNQTVSSNNPVSLMETAFSRSQRLHEQGPSTGCLSLIQCLEEEFAPLQGEVDNSLEDLEPCYRRGIERAGREVFAKTRQALIPGGRSSQESGGDLDKRHHDRFVHRRSEEWIHPASVTELSLLERLERLSRFIHTSRHVKERSSRGNWCKREAEPAGQYRWRETTPAELRDTRQNGELEEANWRLDHKKRARNRGGGDESRRRTEHGETTDRTRGSREQPVRLAWTEDHSQKSTRTEPSLNHRCYPAERDKSGSRLGEMDVAIQTESSDTTGTVSTIDTPRLLRAFGPQRVTSGLERLHSTVDRQRERKANSKRRAPPVSDSNSTDDFTVPAQGTSPSVLSTSTDSQPPCRGATRDIQVKRSVKLVSKGIQAGDLEIVSNGTRKHTRDVGTTFPSPQSSRRLEVIASDSKGINGEQKTPPQPQDPENGSWSQPMVYPPGVSWFIPTDKEKKENRPDCASGPGPVWFEPFTKMKPWREPLRERQVQDEPVSSRERSQRQPAPDDTVMGKVPSALVRVTLQEALELHRPDFISCSRERMKKLGLRAEERRLQAMFAQEREDLFNRPTGTEGHTIPTGPLVYAKRVIPKKEMFMRSKKMYCRLPEVQRKKEEERRRAEYRSYRLKAQLYKKKITNHVLGRKTPWQ